MTSLRLEPPFWSRASPGWVLSEDSKPFWEVSGCSLSLLGNRELHDAASAPDTWIYLQPSPVVFGVDAYITLTALLRVTQMPQSPLGVLSSWLPETGGGLGQERAGHRAPSQCCSLSFYPKKFSCSSGTGKLPLISPCGLPTLMFIHGFRSWSRIHKSELGL